MNLPDINSAKDHPEMVTRMQEQKILGVTARYVIMAGPS